MSMFSCGNVCVPKDSAMDTVKVNKNHMNPPEESRQEEQERQEQEVERHWLEEQMRREKEQAEEEKQRELEEALRRAAREEAVRAEAARQAEVERQLIDQGRKSMVGAFLKEHGYVSADAPKKTMLKTKYPIHTAAKIGDPKLIAALIEEGADPMQKDSTRKTALEVAERCNRKGSHAGAERALS
mmetsp:Transcript_116388/g.329848  ORF Transcript_116388/g.329848 Transcript_116388/m.329848 type:complete len:185 (+) Transcript_116388:48-602(+)